MSAVGRIGRDGVEQVGVGGGEERVEPPLVEQGVLTGGGVCFGVEVRDPAHHQPARQLLGLLLRGERSGDLGDLRPGDPAPGVLVEDRVGVLDGSPGVLVIAAIAALIWAFIRTVTDTASPSLTAAWTGPRP